MAETPDSFPMTEAFYDACLSLPLFPDMTDEDVERVVEAVRDLEVRAA